MPRSYIRQPESMSRICGCLGSLGPEHGRLHGKERARTSTRPGGRFPLARDQYIELAAAVASIETNFAFFQSKSEIVLKGRKASYRVADRQRVFLSMLAPNEAPLVRLKPGDDHDDRNLKYS